MHQSKCMGFLRQVDALRSELSQESLKNAHIIHSTLHMLKLFNAINNAN